MLEELNNIPYLKNFTPDKLSENPYWIWGGAVLDGFFGSPYLTGVPPIRHLLPARPEPACLPLRRPGRRAPTGHLP